MTVAISPTELGLQEAGREWIGIKKRLKDVCGDDREEIDNCDVGSSGCGLIAEFSPLDQMTWLIIRMRWV